MCAGGHYVCHFSERRVCCQWLLMFQLSATGGVHVQKSQTQVPTAGLYKAFTFKRQREHLLYPWKPFSQLHVFHLFHQLLSVHLNLCFRPVWSRSLGCCLIRLKDPGSHSPLLFMSACGSNSLWGANQSCRWSQHRLWLSCHFPIEHIWWKYVTLFSFLTHTRAIIRKN